MTTDKSRLIAMSSNILATVITKICEDEPNVMYPHTKFKFNFLSNLSKLSFFRDMVEIRKKKKHLDNKCTNYSYLKQLRQAFNEENERRYESLSLVVRSYHQS